MSKYNHKHDQANEANETRNQQQEEHYENH